MTLLTYLLLVLALIVAFLLSFYQYLYPNKKVGVHVYLLFGLRTISWMCVFLLLINPKFQWVSFQEVKPVLPVYIDNSSSIGYLSSLESVETLKRQIKNNKKLNQQFDVQYYTLDNDVNATDTLTLKGKQSHLEKASKNNRVRYRNKRFPTLLLTDGNQTKGNDFAYAFDVQNPVFSVVLGDTTAVADLNVQQINVNPYAFLKNKFPVEVFLQYTGKNPVTSNFFIKQDDRILFQQKVDFSLDKRSQILQVLLPAEKVGVQVFKAILESNLEEKNLDNNIQNFAVEVIDQKTEVALISEINHPDLGALKRAIESNQQRNVKILKPGKIDDLSAFDVLVLYQPNGSFRNIFEQNNKLQKNTWIITGLGTDFNFLNQMQTSFQFKMSKSKEDYLSAFNTQFNLFLTEDKGFESLPPLQNLYGTVTIQGDWQTLMFAKIRNAVLDQPLWALGTNGNSRTAFLLGEDLWKWRSKVYLNTESFDAFDLLIDKTIQFLNTNDRRKNLIVTHKNFYNSGDNIEINAQFFNKNYEPEPNAQLTLTWVDKKSQKSSMVDLLKSTQSFKANLEGIPAGSYNFTVKEKKSNAVYQGYFEVIDFDIEKQFVTPNFSKLQELAVQTSGNVMMPNQFEDFLKKLSNSQEYPIIEKQIKRKIPLIEWYFLLILLVITLGSEWFIRKYHGLL
jgi:hypothetical protein